MNGIILINKPLNCTSHDVVYKIKKMLNTKIGHTGTLDPLAEGVLPLLIGKGTLCSKYLINHDKKYITTIQLGEKTETGDLEGKIIERKEVNENTLTFENINSILKNFIGEQEQLPPMYSAIKVNGKKLYEYARKGIEVKVQPRKIFIYNLELTEINIVKKQITIEVFCGKGTYIRTLCEDIAEKLGTVGYMKSLQRTQVGDFNIKDCMILENTKNDTAKIEKSIISIEQLFTKNEKIDLKDDELKKFLNGTTIFKDLPDEVYRIYDKDGIFIGLGAIKNKLLKRDIILK